MNTLFTSICTTGLAALLLIVPKYATAQNCTGADPGNTPGSLGCVSFMYQGQPVTYSTVRSADGKIWLRQNLGSTKAAASLTDTGAYGDLFQWGRWDDGHQLANSTLEPAAPVPNNPSGLNGGNSGFYSAGYQSTSNWWSEGTANDQWTADGSSSSVTATNGSDPCRAIGTGWRLPAVDEIETVLAAENISDISSAFASNLKLVPAGMKDYNGIFSPGTRLYLWSSSSSPYTGSGQHLYISPYSALTNSGGRDGGMSVRCIKETSVLSVSDFRKTAVMLYPNPTHGMLYLKADAAIESVHVTDTSGRKVKLRYADGKIDTVNLPVGMYIMEIAVKNKEKIIRKIIKN